MQLHLVQSINPKSGGGLTSSCLEFVNAQNKMGVKSNFFSTTSDEPYDNIFKRTHELPFLYAPGFKEHVLNQEAPYLHNHGLYMYSSYLANLHKKKFGSKMIVHVHGMFEPWVLKRSKWKKSLVNVLFEKYKYSYAEYWRALTLKEADQIKKFGVKGEIVILPNGIDLEKIDNYISENNFNDSSEKKSMLFLGRLHPKKGIVELVMSWMSIPKVVRNGWQLDIVGPDEGVLSNLLNLTKYSDDINFHGSVYGVEKFSLLAAADFFILPSYSEGFSMGILEAMAFSKPVIMTDACNFQEAYVEGAIKLPDQTSKWTLELSNILSYNALERKSRGESLRRFVEKKYQWRNIALGFQELLKE